MSICIQKLGDDDDEDMCKLYHFHWISVLFVRPFIRMQVLSSSIQKMFIKNNFWNWEEVELDHFCLYCLLLLRYYCGLFYRGEVKP